MKHGYKIETVDYYNNETRFIICKNYHSFNQITNYHLDKSYYIINYMIFCDEHTVAVFKIKPKTVK